MVDKLKTKTINELRKDAAELLKKGEVDVVIGYGEAHNETSATPIFIKDAKDVERLIFNPFSFNNLAIYLTHKEIKALGKAAVVAKERDIMALIALVQESQLNPEDVVILGIKAREMGKKDGGWEYLGRMTVGEAEKYIQENFKELGLDEVDTKRIEELLSLDTNGRWDYWMREFSKCIKCYACRQACSLCYCNECIVEKNQPQWVSTNINDKGNLSWNIVRAFHLAGRCIGCGECERACPMGIPLNTLNGFLSKIIYENYEYLTGRSTEESPPLTVFKEDDKEDFIK